MSLTNSVNSSHGLQYLKNNGNFPTIVDGNLNDTLLAQGSDTAPVWLDNKGIITTYSKLDNINFKTTGAIVAYTPPNGYNFVLENIISFYTSLTSISADAQFSLGINSPSYSDYISQIYVTGQMTPTLGYFAINALAVRSSNPPAFSTSSAPIYANITTGATATTAIGTIIFTGYLVPQ